MDIGKLPTIRAACQIGAAGGLCSVTIQVGFYHNDEAIADSRHICLAFSIAASSISSLSGYLSEFFLLLVISRSKCIHYVPMAMQHLVRLHETHRCPSLS